MNLVCPSCAVTNRVPEAKLHDGAICGKCGTALMESAPVALDDATLPRFIAGTELPVLVDFWAAWCGPCRQMAPRFAKVDSDAAPRASATHGIRSIPTLILFDQGVEVARLSGAVPVGELTAWVRSHIGRATPRAG